MPGLLWFMNRVFHQQWIFHIHTALRSAGSAGIFLRARPPHASYSLHTLLFIIIVSHNLPGFLRSNIPDSTVYFGSSPSYHILPRHSRVQRMDPMRFPCKKRSCGSAFHARSVFLQLLNIAGAHRCKYNLGYAFHQQGRADELHQHHGHFKRVEQNNQTERQLDHGCDQRQIPA